MLKRIISLALVFIMILSALALASCGKKNDKPADKDAVTTDDAGSEVEDTGEADTAETEDPNQAILDFLETYAPEETAESYVDEMLPNKYDYKGYTFRFLNSERIYNMYVFLDPEMTGDVLDDCCYERNFLAEQYFNITIDEETQPYADITKFAKTLILSGEEAYDVMYIPVCDLTPMISENLFYDLLEIDELNIDRIWWDQPLITRNTIDDRLFYATSDMHLMAFEAVWALYFNEQMMKDLNLEAPFDLALSGKWTFDAFKQYCTAASNLNGDTSFIYDDNGKAVYGMSYMGVCEYFVYAMNSEYCSRDNTGRYHFTADTDPKFINTWDRIIDLFGKDSGFVLCANHDGLKPGGYFRVFEDGRALFLNGQLMGATMLREWDGSFGLLPMPKYDESQKEYDSLVGTSVLCFCIPHTNTNLSRTGTIVDYLTYMSYTSLLPRYYDIHVALKALGKQESIDVLAIIRGTRGCEVAVPYGWCTELNAALKTLVKPGDHAVASTIEKYREAVIAKIDDMYKSYPSLNHVG